MHPAIHSKTNPAKAAHIIAGTGETVTYAALEQRSNQGAHLFRSLGLGRGDAVAMMLDNTARNLEIAWAAQRSGLYLTCISVRLTPADFDYILRDSAAKLLVTSARYAEQIHAAGMDLGNLHIYVAGGASSHFPAWETACASRPVTPIADESPGADMLYSSGTTGRPKGVKGPLPEGPVEQTNGLTEMGKTLYAMNADTVFYSPAPLYHAAPLRWCMAVQKLGGTVIISEKFDPQAALALMDQYRVTHAQWVPTHFVRLLNLPQAVRASYDCSALVGVFHAAAPCPVSVKQAMIDWWGPVIHEYYSGTECPGITAISASEWLQKKGSVGRALIGTVKICDDNGDEVAAGEQGGVYFANGPVFEYHHDPEKTRKSRNQHGWATLGDVGYVDADGYLFLTDRKDFMIISGGVNIYPQEIENCLIEHPQVLDVAVLGLPDAEMGEQAVAVIQLKTALAAGDNAARDALREALREFCHARMGSLKTPRIFEFWAELPRLPTGKIQKKLIREQLAV